jgi:hypothetical protein
LRRALNLLAVLGLLFYGEAPGAALFWAVVPVILGVHLVGGSRPARAR